VWPGPVLFEPNGSQDFTGLGAPNSGSGALCFIECENRGSVGGKADQAFGNTTKPEQLFARLDVPQRCPLDVPTVAARTPGREAAAAVRAEQDAVQLLRTIQGADQLTGLRIPDVSAGVAVGRYDRGAIVRVGSVGGAGSLEVE